MIKPSVPPPAELLTPPPLLPCQNYSFSSSPSFKPILNAKSLHHRLLSLIHGGHLHRAISTLDLMDRYGTHPSPVTYSVLLKSCIRTRNFQLGRHVHSLLTQSGLDFDPIPYNSLISLYSKCGDLKQASAIFQNMGNKRDLASWSALMACFANNEKECEAILTFIDMLQMGLEPNEYCFAAVIRACSNADYLWIGEIFFAFLLKKGYFESNVHVGCALIDMYVQGSKNLDSALKVFNKMPKKNVVTWSLMIARCTQLGYPEDAIGLFFDMVLSGFEPDGFTMSALVSVCTELQLLSLGKQLHSWAVKAGLTSDACVGCSFVDMYSKCAANGSVKDPRKMFDGMLEHNVMSWTAIMNGHVRNGEKDTMVVELFYQMLLSQVSPNQLTLAGILKACRSISDPRMSEQVYAHAVKRGFASDNHVINSFIRTLVQSDRTEDARKVFELLLEKKLVSPNATMDGNFGTLSPEGFKRFQGTIDRQMGVVAFTLASLLGGAATVGAIARGEQIHARVLKAGLESDKFILNALITMYSKCGDINAAHKVFLQTENANVLSWTSMITGFAKHGYAVKALEMFHEMLEANVRPNEVTYIAILSACSHVGLVSEGERYFKWMYKEHGIVPRMVHYACMVDLYGRTGSLKKALEFINSMPLKPNALVWRTFLGACKVHGVTDLGKHAATMILDQDSHDEAAHVLLSNLYAASGQWDRAAEVRKKMKERNLAKEAGYSRIEVKSEVYKFYSGDTSHPQAKEIYDGLDRLVKRIRTIGYVPKTEFVLHELEEEELKEQFLLQHSEKLAVTFGLLSMPASKPIRVFKNLRVCGDCHDAIKYISLATGREIILRDWNRFHHISNGRCSCNDYW